MSAINEHHDAAMDFAHFALLERARGNTEEAAALFEKALENELAAIQDMEARGSFAEPTYSVLHRSAGTLAMDCKQYRLAERLAAKGLAHAEHPEIAQELRDLLEQVNFHRRLELKGVELGDGEMQLSLSGPEVGSGTALLSDLTRIVGNVEDFIYRIIEWTRDSSVPREGTPAQGYQGQLPHFRFGSKVWQLCDIVETRQPNRSAVLLGNVGNIQDNQMSSWI